MSTDDGHGLMKGAQKKRRQEPNKHSDGVTAAVIYDVLKEHLVVKGDRVLFLAGWDDAKVTAAATKAMPGFYINKTSARTIRTKYFGSRNQLGPHAFKLPKAGQQKAIAAPAPEAPKIGFKTLMDRLSDLEQALAALGQPASAVVDHGPAVATLQAQVDDLKTRLDYLEEALGGK